MAGINDEYVRLLRHLLPSGPAWEGESDYLVEGLAPSLGRVHDRAGVLMKELDPGSTVELIDRYEALCGLPDECIPDGTQTLTQRQRRLAAKVNGYGGINEAFYRGQLAALGHGDATITQFQNCAPDAPDSWPEEATADDYRYFWRVNMPVSANIDVMTCSDRCNAFLRTWGDTVAECVIDKLCPSHTTVLFAYGDTEKTQEYKQRA